MKWSRAKDVLRQLENLWQRGDVLANTLHDTPIFPLCIKLKAPSSSEISAEFDAVRAWVTELKAIPHARLEMREIHHRLFGNNHLPHAVWLDTREAALTLLGKNRDAARFSRIIENTRQAQPQLLPWLSKRSMRALALHAEWDRLLAIVNWLQLHPRPTVYLRQVDLPGIDSKFIEQQRAVLTELLDISLPADAIDANATGLQGFARRYGFLDKPLRVRLRSLDPHLSILAGVPNQDISLNADSFAALSLHPQRVFITENEINYLAFPNVANSLLIFGAGYGFEVMKQASWLNQCALYYWGDIDTDGFAILDQLRATFPHVQSILMDQACLLAHQSMWGKDEKQQLRQLTRLHSAEADLLHALKEGRFGEKPRLEQERIGFAWLERALNNILES